MNSLDRVAKETFDNALAVVELTYRWNPVYTKQYRREIMQAGVIDEDENPAVIDDGEKLHMMVVGYVESGGSTPYHNVMFSMTYHYTSYMKTIPEELTNQDISDALFALSSVNE